MRIATVQDKNILTPLLAINNHKMKRNICTDLVVDKILADVKHGFVIVALEDEQAAGFMMFTYEWSDWRDGVFLWLQAAEAST